MRTVLKSSRISAILFFVSCSVSSLPPGAPQDLKVLEKVSAPSSRTSSSAKFLPDERKLDPGTGIYFVVPEDLTGNYLDFIHVWHRQARGSKERFGHDEHPGHSALLLYAQWGTPTQTGWRLWNGPGVGRWHAKFAEPRRNINQAERDTWYEWPKIGHCALDGKNCSTDPIKVKGFLIVSEGDEAVFVSHVEITTAPPSSKWQTKIYSSYLTMGDPVTQHSVMYMGGTGGALRLDPKDEASTSIPLTADSQLRSVEIAVEDGEFGRARLEAIVHHADGTEVTLLHDENVPPAGSVVGYAPVEGLRTGAGDELIIRANTEMMRVHGVRIGYD